MEGIRVGQRAWMDVCNVFRQFWECGMAGFPWAGIGTVMGGKVAVVVVAGGGGGGGGCLISFLRIHVRGGASLFTHLCWGGCLIRFPFVRIHVAHTFGLVNDCCIVTLLIPSLRVTLRKQNS